MALSITHQFVSAIADGGDTSLVQPSNWNATHTISGLSSSGSLLFDNSGALAETSGLTWDSTNETLTLGGATVTTSHPLLDMTQTWNAGAVTFTGLRLNVTSTASAAASLLMDLQVGSASQLAIRKDGTVVPASSTLNVVNNITLNGSNANLSNVNSGLTLGDQSEQYAVTIKGGVGVQLKSSLVVAWTDGTSYAGTADTFLYRDAANTLALRNSTNAQTFRVYGTYTDASNFERLEAQYSATNTRFELQSSKLGTGSYRPLFLGCTDTAGGGTVTVNPNGFNHPIAFGRYTVATDWVIDDSGFFLAVTDNARDIGASGANRPRNAYIATGINVGASGTMPVVFQATAVNMNSVADTAFTITLPPNYTRYRVLAIVISHASVDLTAATTVQFGLFTSTGGGGTAVLSATSCTVSATADATANNLQFQAPTLANTSFTAGTLQFRVTTAHGSAATADVTLYIQPVP